MDRTGPGGPAVVRDTLPSRGVVKPALLVLLLGLAVGLGLGAGIVASEFMNAHGLMNGHGQAVIGQGDPTDQAFRIVRAGVAGARLPFRVGDRVVLPGTDDAYVVGKRKDAFVPDLNAVPADHYLTAREIMANAIGFTVYSGDRVRILEVDDFWAYICAETGAYACWCGWIPVGFLDPNGDEATRHAEYGRILAELADGMHQ